MNRKNEMKRRKPEREKEEKDLKFQDTFRCVE